MTERSVAVRTHQRIIQRQLNLLEHPLDGCQRDILTHTHGEASGNFAPNLQFVVCLFRVYDLLLRRGRTIFFLFAYGVSLVEMAAKYFWFDRD